MRNPSPAPKRRPLLHSGPGDGAERDLSFERPVMTQRVLASSPRDRRPMGSTGQTTYGSTGHTTCRVFGVEFSQVTAGVGGPTRQISYFGALATLISASPLTGRDHRSYTSRR